MATIKKNKTGTFDVKGLTKFELLGVIALASKDTLSANVMNAEVTISIADTVDKYKDLKEFIDFQKSASSFSNFFYLKEGLDKADEYDKQRGA
ncbi:MAG: hypothetical protein V3U54_07850 [Thermodesulfobacteriota bacterium]